MKRLLAVLGLGALLTVGLASGLVAGGVADATIVTGGGHDPVTVCHKPGTPAQHSLTFDDDAYLAHLNHGDTLGPCGTTEPVDVCPNLDDVQTEVPDGYKLEDGQCVLKEAKVTICHKPGTPAEQTKSVPEEAVPGHLGHGDYLGECKVTPPPPTDVCPNIDGDQGSVPDGMVIAEGKCVTPPPRLCPDGKPPTPGEGAYDPNDDCKRPPAPVTETTPATTPDTTPTTTTVITPTTTTVTTPTTPEAPFTPPPTTKPAVKKPAAKKPAVKTAPAPKKAVAGAFAQEPPKLAYTP